MKFGLGQLLLIFGIIIKIIKKVKKLEKKVFDGKFVNPMDI